MDVTLDETESFYMCPQLQGKSSMEDESLESSFVPFGTLGTSLGTSHMDAYKVAPNKGTFVFKLESTSKIVV